MTTIIIGAGASGLACAIRLKQNNPTAEVLVLERLAQPGRKILATGNGRCNFTNTNAEGSSDVIAFFNSIGLKEKYEDDGRVYPYSNQASTVLEMLLSECERLGVNIVTDCTVQSIDRELCVSTDCGIYMPDCIVVAAGGKAQSALGSNGSGYSLLRDIGHNITPVYPALVQLTSSSKYPRLLKGCRARCTLQILLDNESVGADNGEILFTDYGLSGIVAMNLSALVSKNFANANSKKCHAVIDLAPDISEDELRQHIERFGDLNGVLGSRLGSILMKQADGDPERLAKYAKSWKLIITGTKGFDFAQITAGGADVEQFENFQSRLVPGVYVCGELLDRQFECGGYNLNFSFYSGIKTADEISKNLNS